MAGQGLWFTVVRREWVGSIGSGKLDAAVQPWEGGFGRAPFEVQLGLSEKIASACC